MLFDVAEDIAYFLTNALTSTPMVRDKLKELETAELERILAGCEEYKLLERIEHVSSNHPPQVEYRALGSMGVFRKSNQAQHDGRSIEDWVYHNRLRSARVVDSWVSRNQDMTIRIQYGLETLWRSAAPPVVMETCNKFEKIRSNKALSGRAKRILARTNFKGRKSTRYPRAHDAFYLRSRSNRLFDLVVTILHTSMLRRDYKHAYAALAMLLRRKYFDHRAVYAIATELAQWKSDRALRFTTWFSATHQWTQHLNLPIIRGKTVNPMVIKVRLVLPMCIASMRLRLGASAAFERLDSQIRDLPYATFALNWAIHGSLAAELAKWEVASRSFAQAARLGGHVPWYYVDLVNSRSTTQKALEKCVDPLAYTFDKYTDSDIKPAVVLSADLSSTDGEEGDTDMGEWSGPESDGDEERTGRHILDDSDNHRDGSSDSSSEGEIAGSESEIDIEADIETDIETEDRKDHTAIPQGDNGRDGAKWEIKQEPGTEADEDENMDETDLLDISEEDSGCSDDEDDDADADADALEPTPHFLATSEPLQTDPFDGGFGGSGAPSSPPAAQAGSSFGYMSEQHRAFEIHDPIKPLWETSPDHDEH